MIGDEITYELSCACDEPISDGLFNDIGDPSCGTSGSTIIVPGLSAFRVGYAALAEDHRTYTDTSLKNKSFFLYLGGTVNRFLENSEYAVLVNGGFELVYEIGPDDYVLVFGATFNTATVTYQAQKPVAEFSGADAYYDAELSQVTLAVTLPVGRKVINVQVETDGTNLIKEEAFNIYQKVDNPGITYICSPGMVGGDTTQTITVTMI